MSWKLLYQLLISSYSIYTYLFTNLFITIKCETATIVMYIYQLYVKNSQYNLITQLTRGGKSNSWKIRLLQWPSWLWILHFVVYMIRIATCLVFYTLMQQPPGIPDLHYTWIFLLYNYTAWQANVYWMVVVSPRNTILRSQLIVWSLFLTIFLHVQKVT